MALFKINKGNKMNLPLAKTEGYMYITEDVGDIYLDVSSNKRIRLNAEASEKIRKIIYNEDGTYLSEVSINYDDILNMQNSIVELETAIYNNAPSFTQEVWQLANNQSSQTLTNDYPNGSILVYYNGLLINENLHYSFESNTISFLDFTAELGDILTIVGVSNSLVSNINPAILIGGAY